MLATSSYWESKAALVTGGSAGLGLHLAEALLRAGASVTIVGRDAQRLARAEQRLGGERLCVAAADITSDEGPRRCVEAALRGFGRLDLLVNCAGTSDRGTLAETTSQRFRELWELNFLAAARMCQACLPALAEQKGHIVNIGSLACKTAPRFLGAYAVSKFPLAALSQQLRLELEPQGVHVLLACPGPIRRDDAGRRYQSAAADLPPQAGQPGGGAKVKLLDPEDLSRRILAACQRRELELIVPAKARWLFALSQLWPAWGDRILRKKSG